MLATKVQSNTKGRWLGGRGVKGRAKKEIKQQLRHCKKQNVREQQQVMKKIDEGATRGE